MGVEFRLGIGVGADLCSTICYPNYDCRVPRHGHLQLREGGFAGEDLPASMRRCRIWSPISIAAWAGWRRRAIHDLAGQRVVVLGGGDTGMDCNRTAIRQGAESVTCTYRRDELHMPGSRRDYKNSKEEGVEFRFNSQPVEISGQHQGRGRQDSHDAARGTRSARAPADRQRARFRACHRGRCGDRRVRIQAQPAALVRSTQHRAAPGRAGTRQRVGGAPVFRPPIRRCSGGDMVRARTWS